MKKEAIKVGKGDERCTCGHEYGEHARTWDEKRSRYMFACNGPCAKCDCLKYAAREKGESQ